MLYETKQNDFVLNINIMYLPELFSNQNEFMLTIYYLFTKDIRLHQDQL